MCDNAVFVNFFCGFAVFRPPQCPPPRGGKQKEGVTLKAVNSTHFWTQLEDTDFSLGVVVPDARQKEELDTLQPPRGTTDCTVIVISKVKEVK